MKDPRSRGLATSWRGLLFRPHAPANPRAGCVVLDWNPVAEGLNEGSSFLFVFLYGCCAVIALLVVGLAASSRPGILPCLAVALFVVGLLLYASIRELFGREQLWIDERGIEHLWTDGVFRWRRRIPIADVRRLTPYGVWVRNQRDEGCHAEYGLAIETVGPTLLVGRCPDPERPEELRAELGRQLGEWSPGWAEAPPCAEREVLDERGFRDEPPADSRLRCRRDWDGTEFVLRCPARKSSLIALILLIAIAVAVVGATSYPALVVVPSAGIFLIAALSRRRWLVRPGEVSSRFPALGPLGSRTADVEWLDRIELRKVPSQTPWQASFRLALVDPDGNDRAVLGPLTEADARWMAGIVADVLRDALPRRDQDVRRWSVIVDEPSAGSSAMADAWLDSEPGEPHSKRTATNAARSSPGC